MPYPDKKNILLVRTHKELAGGGPVPCLGLLSLASVIMRSFGARYNLKILHTGVKGLTAEDVKRHVRQEQPYIVGLSAMTCEADLMRGIAAGVKETDKNIIVMAGGPHATLAGEGLLEDRNIDYGVFGEGEDTLVELLKTLEEKGDFSKIKGIAYRDRGKVILTPPRPCIEDLDKTTILSSAWDLIDIKEYAKHPNWNGLCRERFYFPVMTSRGCPFNCVFCRSKDTFGRGFRARSPENVFAEMMALYEKYNIREIHFFDDVFNFDAKRAERICSLLIESGIRFSLAFPNGLRADIMTDGLLDSLKRAGCYKINYGIETATPRLQQLIKKDLDISRVRETVDKTVKKGILTAGYFILGFPTETSEEIEGTIDFAAASSLDNAYFFKFTDFLSLKPHRAPFAGKGSAPGSGDFHFYSAERAPSGISPDRLNDLILKAQERFYMSLKRICRGFFRSTHKTAYLKNLLSLFALFFQARLLRQLKGPSKS